MCFQGLLEMLLIKIKSGVSELWQFRECNLELYTDLENILHKNAITQLEDFLFDKYKVNWQNRMFSQKVGNKLRTYKLFKEVFETEMYFK
jgi:hypothetical protein